MIKSNTSLRVTNSYSSSNAATSFNTATNNAFSLAKLTFAKSLATTSSKPSLGAIILTTSAAISALFLVKILSSSSFATISVTYVKSRVTSPVKIKSRVPNSYAFLTISTITLTSLTNSSLVTESSKKLTSIVDGTLEIPKLNNSTSFNVTSSLSAANVTTSRSALTTSLV